MIQNVSILDPDKPFLSTELATEKMKEVQKDIQKNSPGKCQEFSTPTTYNAAEIRFNRGSTQKPIALSASLLL